MTRKRLIELLWSNIENGTVDKNFFELREYVRRALKPPSEKASARTRKMLEQRKTSGNWNTGRPPKHDWDKIINSLGHLTVSQASQQYKVSYQAIYSHLKKKGIKP